MQEDSRSRRSRRAAWALLLAVLPVAAWVLWQSQRLVRADLASLAERHQVTAWASGAKSPATAQEWVDARDAIRQSLAITPDDPAMQERMGDVFFVAARRDWADVDQRRAHLVQALGHYEAAIALRPSEPQTWAMLATAVQGMGGDTARVHAAWAKAQALGPYEGHIRPILLRLVLSDWEGASPAMQQWAKTLFDKGNAGTRWAINNMASQYGLQFAPDAASAP